MNIYIVRHGETQWNKEEVFRGRKDIPLNEAGKRQAEQAGAYFVDIPGQRRRQRASARRQVCPSREWRN
jgi:broad specificity phosphatase PhoE